MADKRTTRLFAGAAALLVPAVSFTILLVMQIWKLLFASGPKGGLVVDSLFSLFFAGCLWFPGIVLFRRGLQSRALDKEQDRPKIIT